LQQLPHLLPLRRLLQLASQCLLCCSGLHVSNKGAPALYPGLSQTRIR
jgi:hypothetical protein